MPSPPPQSRGAGAGSGPGRPSTIWNDRVRRSPAPRAPRLDQGQREDRTSSPRRARRTPGQINCHQVRRSVDPPAARRPPRPDRNVSGAAAVASATSGTPLAGLPRPSLSSRQRAQGRPAGRQECARQPPQPDGAKQRWHHQWRQCQGGQNGPTPEPPANDDAGQADPSTRDPSVTQSATATLFRAQSQRKGSSAASARETGSAGPCPQPRGRSTAAGNQREGRGKYGNPEARPGPSSQPAEDVHPHRFIPDQ